MLSIKKSAIEGNDDYERLIMGLVNMHQRINAIGKGATSVLNNHACIFELYSQSFSKHYEAVHCSTYEVMSNKDFAKLLPGSNSFVLCK